MNALRASNRFSVLLVSASVLIFGVLWWASEVRATAAAPMTTVPPAAPSVQDSEPKIDLDTKIFLHRNARIVTATVLPVRV